MRFIVCLPRQGRKSFANKSSFCVLKQSQYVPLHTHMHTVIRDKNILFWKKTVVEMDRGGYQKHGDRKFIRKSTEV
jgi:hypothetical protein